MSWVFLFGLTFGFVLARFAMNKKLYAMGRADATASIEAQVAAHVASMNTQQQTVTVVNGNHDDNHRYFDDDFDNVNDHDPAAILKRANRAAGLRAGVDALPLDGLSLDRGHVAAEKP